jgi:hypothetical protein
MGGGSESLSIQRKSSFNSQFQKNQSDGTSSHHFYPSQGHAPHHDVYTDRRPDSMHSNSTTSSSTSSSSASSSAAHYFNHSNQQRQQFIPPPPSKSAPKNPPPPPSTTYYKNNNNSSTAAPPSPPRPFAPKPNMTRIQQQNETSVTIVYKPPLSPPKTPSSKIMARSSSLMARSESNNASSSPSPSHAHAAPPKADTPSNVEGKPDTSATPATMPKKSNRKHRKGSVDEKEIMIKLRTYIHECDDFKLQILIAFDVIRKRGLKGRSFR